MGETNRWVCWHPELEYLTFGNSTVQATPEPNPRGSYTRREHAENRKKDPIWLKRRVFRGEDIQVRYVKFSWEVLPAPEASNEEASS